MKYIIKTQCKEMLAFDNSVLTEGGKWVWVVEEQGGWVEATSSPTFPSNSVPKDIKVFDREQEAIKFIKKWKGHPWYVVPNGVYEILCVEPKYKTVQDGWDIK